MGFWSRDKPGGQVQAADKALTCSFCGKPQQDVYKLIAGPTVYICDECVGLCNDIIAEERELAAPADLPAILGHLDAAVVGHAAAKRVLAAALSLHLRGLRDEAPPPGPRRVLLVGPRGTGKSALLQALTLFDRRLPSYIAAASRLTETGYVGENVENLLHGLLRCTADREAAHRGLLVLDGVHHLVFRRPFATFARDISGSEVQRELVRVLDGQVAEVFETPPKHPQKPTQSFPCDRLLIAASATFDAPTWPEDDAALRAWLVAAGLVDELVARFDAVVPVRRLSADELVEVAARAAAPTRRLLEAVGAPLDLRPDGVRRIAEAAAASPDGAFALFAPLSRIAERALVEAPRHWVLDAALANELLAAR